MRRRIKLVWYYNNVLGREQKKKIISRVRGYHGSGILTGSMTGLPIFHDHFDLPLEVIKHTVTPHFYREARPGMSEKQFSAWCADELEKLILAEGPDTVAAFIGEPVMGTGGLIPPPEGYWSAIQSVLQEYDHSADCRRGRHRVRPNRRRLRLHSVRHRAGSDYRRQGFDQRVPSAFGCDRRSTGLGCVGGRRQEIWPVWPRLDLLGACARSRGC